MKRLAFSMIFVLLTFCFAFTGTSEAWVWDADYPYSSDTSVIYDRYSWDYYNHAVVNWNNGIGTASEIIMDSNGAPWLYYWGWGDFFTYYVDIYYS